MISFGKPKGPDRLAAIKRVGSLAEDRLKALPWVLARPADGDFDDGLRGLSVTVSEIQCKEEGCAPVETVVTLLSSTKGEKPRMGKVYKPTADVSAADVAALVDASFGPPGSEPVVPACCS